MADLPHQLDQGSEVASVVASEVDQERGGEALEVEEDSVAVTEADMVEDAEVLVIKAVEASAEGEVGMEVALPTAHPPMHPLDPAVVVASVVGMPDLQTVA